MPCGHHDRVEILAATGVGGDEAASKRMSGELAPVEAGLLRPVPDAIGDGGGSKTSAQASVPAESPKDGALDDARRREPGVEGPHGAVLLAVREEHRALGTSALLVRLALGDEEDDP